MVHVLRDLFSKSSLKEITEAVEAMARGDLSQNLSSGEGDWGRLTLALQKISSRLQLQGSKIEEERNQLKTILDGMIEGVLVTNERSEVILANPALQTMLELRKDYAGKTLLECIRHPKLYEAIERVFSEKKAQEQEIAVARGLEEQNFVVRIAPLLRDGVTQQLSGSVSVFHDVTNVRKLENIRRDFVANVSHELKTPLTCIRGYAETLKQGAIEDSTVARRFLEKIENNAAQLQSLVEDILHLAQLDSGQMEMNITNVSLSVVTKSLLEEFNDVIANKKLEVVNDVSEEVLLRADSQLVRQILRNLIENAIKYTPDSGRIEISAEQKQGLWNISVKDTGIGIPEKDLPRIFERFYRVDKSRTRQSEGTGLGLAIVKHLVQLQGGEVNVKSIVDQGSQFSFTIPSVSKGEVL